MKCFNCGANLDADKLVCEYCGTVNDDAVQRKQELDKLENENIELKRDVLTKSKEEIRYKIHIRVNIALAVFFILTMVISFVMYLGVEVNLFHKNSNVSDMYKYYETQDYESLYYCMSNGNLFSVEDYPEYSHMALYWRNYNDCYLYYAQAFEEYQQTGQYNKYELERCIEKGCGVLTGEIGSIYDDFWTSNKERMLPYQEQVYILFTGALQIPEEMIAEIYDKVQYDQADEIVEYVLEVFPNE